MFVSLKKPFFISATAILLAISLLSAYYATNHNLMSTINRASERFIKATTNRFANAIKENLGRDTW